MYVNYSVSDSSSGSRAILSKNLDVVKVGSLGNSENCSTSKTGNMGSVTVIILESLSREKCGHELVTGSVTGELGMAKIDSSVHDVNVNSTSVKLESKTITSLILQLIQCYMIYAYWYL